MSPKLTFAEAYHLSGGNMHVPDEIWALVDDYLEKQGVDMAKGRPGETPRRPRQLDFGFRADMPKAPYRPMTVEEVGLATRLGQCSMLPGTFDKRFTRDMASHAQVQHPVITDKQAETLQRLRHRYRRQLGGTR